MTEYKSGALVRVRNRDWVVLPSDSDDLVLLKPLGGSDEEITGIFKPLFKDDEIAPAHFPDPSKDDLGSVSSARLLYNAARLSFRDGAGPFRSLARLSFAPRAYQMVPLIMALKQDLVRLLIADDVGIGKTMEALLIARELLARGEIKRFAVVCLPHLCDQWQAEIKDKFGIEAVVIRSNTQARLDREIQDDRSVYEYYPYQIISIDYIKAESRKQIFVHQAPELVIVDEAHTCTRPKGASKSQQQRYSLIKDLADKPQQHLLLLTATPHSGKPEEFRSLLGLLNAKFEQTDISKATQAERKELAQYFVQRRRADVTKWLDEETFFPEREGGEINYKLTPDYLALFNQVLGFARELVQDEAQPAAQHQGKQRLRYWTALGLLRGIMSSPDAGIDMLKNRMDKNLTTDIDLNAEWLQDLADDAVDNPVLDMAHGYENDHAPYHVLNQSPLDKHENQQLAQFIEALEKLGNNPAADAKIKVATQEVKQWVDEGFHPVIFCRYIATAKYVGRVLAQTKGFKNIKIEVVTSEDPDEVRRERIVQMGASKRRILVATDCLSEGINLQEYFNAVLHYDLPWNPNRIEQREGRVDRFGQEAPKVKAYNLIGEDNPMDGAVLKVILEKIKQIRKSINVSIPFPEASNSVMDAVLHGVLMQSEEARRKTLAQQSVLSLDFGEEAKTKITQALEDAAEREKLSRSVFTQNALKPEVIKEDLKQATEAIGTPADVERFVTDALNHFLGAQITARKQRSKRATQSYDLYTTNLPEALKASLPAQGHLQVCFHSPTPEGHLYLGRNHPFVEQLAHYLLNDAMHRQSDAPPARTAVIRCEEVNIKTTVYLFRVRNVIESHRKRQIVAEEMLLWGFRGSTNAGAIDTLSHIQAKQLLEQVVPIADLNPSMQASSLEDALEALYQHTHTRDQIAYQRAEALIDAHDRFRQATGNKSKGHSYQVVTPVLPMDLLGVYVLLPQPKLIVK